MNEAVIDPSDASPNEIMDDFLGKIGEVSDTLSPTIKTH